MDPLSQRLSFRQLSREYHDTRFVPILHLEVQNIVQAVGSVLLSLYHAVRRPSSGLSARNLPRVPLARRRADVRHPSRRDEEFMACLHEISFKKKFYFARDFRRQLYSLVERWPRPRSNLAEPAPQ